MSEERTVDAHARRVVSSGAGRVVFAGTGLLGLVSAAVAAGTAPIERTFAAFSGPVQSAMSITVPFLGVLLVSELRRPASRSALVSALLAALVIAVVVALFGVALCATTSALVPSTALGRWHGAITVAVGSVLVQCTAQLVGTGLGLVLWRRPVAACLATLVLPLGLWSLFGVSDVLDPARHWFTPYASAQNLLSGHMSPVGWAQWLVTAAVWGLLLNLLGVRRAVAAG